MRWLAISAIFACTGCSGNFLQKTLAPDPKLKDPVAIGTKASPVPDATANPLPADFPIYPQAKLQSTAQTEAQGTVTAWTTTDPIELVYAFYQKELPAKQWQIVAEPSDSSPQLTAKNDSANVSIAAVENQPADPPASATPQPPGVTKYTISILQIPTETPTPAATSTPAIDSSPTPTGSPAATPKTSTKLPTATADYLADLAKLGVLPSPDPNAAGKTPAINRVVTRREYARWLVAAHNKINGTKPSQQIKLATTDAKPAFQDVPAMHPDFASIQGLAEAGIVSSPLGGDATAVLFRPDAPVTREQMILWKVPLDTRQALPGASLDAVKQTWGFQDAGKIDPQALRAVLADFQNGDRANIRRVFGYTTLFQPKKTVNLGEVATAIWYFGANSEGLSARDVE